MNYLQIMPPVPLPLKVGGHVPQLLWERRPWIHINGQADFTCLNTTAPLHNMGKSHLA